MKRWQKWLWRAGWSLVLIPLVPGLALADNCGSLSDCWNTVAGGLASALGIGAGAAASSAFGNGSSTPGPSVAPPQGDDPSDCD